MVMLLDNTRQARKVRGLQWLMLAWAVGFLAWALSLAQTYGLSPGDGGVLRPPGTRYAVAALVAFIGLLPCWLMGRYGRVYLSRIVQDGDRLELEVLGTWRRRRLSIDRREVVRVTSRAGVFVNPNGVSVNAPWLGLWLAGRRWPLIVDRQAEIVDVRGIFALCRRPSPTAVPPTKTPTCASLRKRLQSRR
jgi:hypothetical protein